MARTAAAPDPRTVGVPSERWEQADRPASDGTADRSESGLPYAKPRPRGLMRLALQIPPLLYRVGLARRLGRRLLLLTTTGRSTGRARIVGLNYARDGDTVYLISGFGRTDWYRNLIADPHVQVQIGVDRWRGEARPVLDPAEQRRARTVFAEQALSQGPPPALRPLIRRTGLDYEAELRRLRDPDLAFPIVAITPADGRGTLNGPG